jgi:membrane associated rhomboid family serine protease
MTRIEPAGKVVWNILKQIIFLPIALLQVLFGKRKSSELFLPIKTAIKFIFQARATISVIAILCCLAVITWAFPDILQSWIHYPQDLLTERWWSFFTASLIHADLIHLGGNILLLFIMGRIVEHELGSAQFLFLYLSAIVLSGVATSIIYLYILPSTVGGLGASGAIMGITAVALLLKPFQLSFELLIPLPLAVVGAMLIYADITNLFTNDGIGRFTHLAGFVLTSLLAYLTNRSKQSQMHTGVVVNLVIGLLMYFFGILQVL